MQATKIEAYLGFALRAGKLTVGVNAIATLKKGVYCLLIDKGMAKNSRKEIASCREKLACPLIEVENLGALIKREGAKAAAVREPSLASAIIEQASLSGMTIEGANG